MASAEPSISRGPGDLAAQLTAIAERAVRMTASSGAAIALRQNDDVITVASHGECVPDVGVSVRPTSFAGRCIVEEALLICHDTDTDPRVDAAACRALNVRSMIAAPIVSEGRTAGVLAVFGGKPNAFVESKVGLIRTLAAIAGEVITPDESLMPKAASSAKVEQPYPPAEPVPSPDLFEAGPEPGKAVVRILPAFDEPELLIHPDPEPATEEPVAADAAPADPRTWLSPQDLSSQLQLGSTSEDDRDLMLFPSLSRQESEPRSRVGLKVAIVLLVVAAIAAGQWLMRGRILKAIHGPVEPQAEAAQSVAPATVTTPPIVVQSVPAPAQPLEATSTEPEAVAPSEASQVNSESAKHANAAQTPAKSQAAKTTSRAQERSVPASKPSAARPAAKGRGTATTTPTELRPPLLLSKVEPVYPPGLKANSTVSLNAMVLKDGSIGKVTVVSGDVTLRQAAVAAVKEWKYKPAYQNGQPVAATVPIDVTFKVAH